MRGQERTKEKRKMKTTLGNKMTYLGAGAGLILFALFGIMPGSMLGGAMGLSIAGALFGTPVEPGVLARMLLAVSMLLGVTVSGLIMVTATSAIGWLMGTAVDAVVRKEAKTVEAQ
jgi:hypothetical protein